MNAAFFCLPVAPFMPKFEHLRHQPPTPLTQPRELIVALCTIAESCQCIALFANGWLLWNNSRNCLWQCKAIVKIARDGADTVCSYRSIVPCHPCYANSKPPTTTLVGLEQTTNSESIYEFSLSAESRLVLVIGNERNGLTPEELEPLDHVVEIPVYGLPFSYNVHTATAMALYELLQAIPAGLSCLTPLFQHDMAIYNTDCCCSFER